VLREHYLALIQVLKDEVEMGFVAEPMRVHYPCDDGVEVDELLLVWYGFSDPGDL
jgi:hypothetical protein